MKIKSLSLVSLFFFLVSHNAWAQSLGVGTNSPNSKAALHVESPANNQGFIMPRLTTALRSAISGLTGTDKGLMVYDTDLNAICIWDGTVWVTSTQGVSGPRLQYPYKDSILSAPNNSNLFKIVYNGTGVENVGAAAFQNLNPSNGFTTLFVTNAGTNGAGYFQVINTNSLSPALRGITNSNQPNVHGFLGRTTGTGGSGGYFEIVNASSGQAAVKGMTNGVGGAAYFENTNTTASGVTGLTSRINTNASGTAIDGQSFGQAGHGGSFITTNASNAFPTVNSISQGSGNAGYFSVSNAANSQPALLSTTVGIGPSISGSQTGLGTAADFSISNPSNTATALNVVTSGTGEAGHFELTNTSNGSAVMSTIHKGNSGGMAIWAEHQGSAPGFAGIFKNSGSTNSFPALVAESLGTGGAGEFKVINALSTGPSVYSITNGTGVALHAETSNTSTTNAAIYGTSNSSSAFAANFRNTNASNTGGAIYLVTYGTGSTTVMNHRGSGGNIAEFQDQDIRVARIDKTGKGFFNGGTQTGGADVAEMFDVEGARNEYESGDVLVISENNDRTVEKSNAPNSSKVAGVYATRPGVVLTEKSIEENLDALVPMGVIGVIPTKVCLENGPIKRGDLLVTSSVKGHAMKAVSVIINGVEIYPTGAILGKALENFDNGTSGLINVLVNVK